MKFIDRINRRSPIDGADVFGVGGVDEMLTTVCPAGGCDASCSVRRNGAPRYPKPTISGGSGLGSLDRAIGSASPAICVALTTETYSSWPRSPYFEFAAQFVFEVGSTIHRQFFAAVARLPFLLDCRMVDGSIGLLLFWRSVRPFAW